MRHRLRVASRAAKQIREAADWWLANRPKAPHAFEEDVEKAFSLISTLPGTGQKVRHAKIRRLRRALLGRVRYYLYYTVDTDEELVKVLAFWHASRRGHPRLE
ncbi:MAG: type II toxin-antitoxin system RelE/ParE family toxin [Acidobacteriota bacterium]